MRGSKGLKLLYILISLSFVNGDYTCESQSSICSIDGQSISASDPFIITGNETSAITFLIISNVFMPQAPQTIFTNYPDISSFTIANTSLQEISPTVFKNALKLTILLIIYGEITTLNNGSFVHCGKLQSLQVVSQQLSSIDILAFQGLKNLQYLILSDNYLTFLHPLIFTVLPKLMCFIIENNLLTTIDSQQFVKNPLLLAVTLSGNHLKTIPNDLFQAQTFLESFHADNNQLVTAQTFGASYVDVSFNKLRNFTISSGEKTVHIDNNVIRKIICGSTNLTVQRFYADNNLLSNFLCIRDMTNLTELSVTNNKMPKPTKKAFLKLINLVELEMVNMTRFTTVPAKVFSPLKSLSNLRVDNLAGYKNLNITFPNLYIIGLSTKSWNCTYISYVKNILESQNIIFNQNVRFDEVPNCSL